MMEKLIFSVRLLIRLTVFSATVVMRVVGKIIVSVFVCLCQGQKSKKLFSKYGIF